MILRKSHSSNWFFNGFNSGFSKFTHFYTRTVGLTLKHKVIGGLAFAGILVALIGLFKMVPGSFVPAEDQGYVVTLVVMPDGATSVSYTHLKVGQYQ